jgi:hypothetical protein
MVNNILSFFCDYILCFFFSTFDYIEELLKLLIKHEGIQISENINEEAENLKVNFK